MFTIGGERTPGFKLFLAIVVGAGADDPALLGLVAGLRPADAAAGSDQFDHRRLGRAAGDGGAGARHPLSRERDRDGGAERAERHPDQPGGEGADACAGSRPKLSTNLRPDVRKRSIYEAVVYDAGVTGKARFVLPPDLARTGVDPAQMDLSRAELRFGLSDPRGLGSNPRVALGGRALRLHPGRRKRRRARLLRVGRRERADGAAAGRRFRLRVPGQRLAEPDPAGGRHALDA